MYKIAVMGAYDSIYGFAALGLNTFPVEGHEEGRRLLHKLAESDYAVIYMTEALAAELEEEVARFKTRVTPAIILIPGREGSIGLGQSALRAAVERAVGTNILGD